jgi:hypothetical protein
MNWQPFKEAWALGVIFVPPVVLSFAAVRNLVGRRSKTKPGRRRRPVRAAIELFAAAAWLFVLLANFAPFPFEGHPRAYDASAEAAGYNTRFAQEACYQHSGPEGARRYTDNLADLLTWDKNLTDDPGVTFVFGACNASGYTFTTTHRHGKRAFRFQYPEATGAAGAR